MLSQDDREVKITVGLKRRRRSILCVAIRAARKDRAKQEVMADTALGESFEATKEELFPAPRCRLASTAPPRVKVAVLCSPSGAKP